VGGAVAGAEECAATQTWHEEEDLASLAWRCVTAAHADQIISKRQNHPMAFEMERMNANPTSVLSNLHRKF
jgi:hypothetical protein